MTDVQFNLHCARVYLAQARHFRAQRDFYWTLMGWAHNSIQQARECAYQGRLSV